MRYIIIALVFLAGNNAIAKDLNIDFSYDAFRTWIETPPELPTPTARMSEETYNELRQMYKDEHDQHVKCMNQYTIDRGYAAEHGYKALQIKQAERALNGMDMCNQ